MALELKHKDWRAAAPMSPAFASDVMERFKSNDERLKTSKQHEINLISWAAYYQRDKDGGGACLLFKGQKGEIISLTPALYRQMIQNQMAQRSQVPLEPEPNATNTDPESQAACRDFVGVAKYYLRFTNLEELLTERAEMAKVLAESFLHVRWDVHKGEKTERAGVKEGDVVEEYEGDFVFELGSRYDVWFDSYSPDLRRPTAWIWRSAVNRFDAQAQWGAGVGNKAIAEAIDRAPEFHSVMESWKFDKRGASETRHDDSIPLYYVYCERSSGCESGRFSIVLDAETVLFDGKLGEDRAGIFPLIPSRVMFRPEGHSNHFGGLALAEARGAELSTAASNRAGHGLAKVLVPREAKIAMRQLMPGLVGVEYTSQVDGMTVPEPSIMAGTSLVDLVLEEKLAQLQDQVQGGSPIMRGQANANDSGAKVAAMYSAAQQVSAPDVLADLKSIGELLTFMLASFKRHASEGRILRIVGQDKSYTVKKYKQGGFKNIESVGMRMPNAARDTFAGRSAFVDAINAAKDERALQAVVSVYTTGNVEVVTGPIEDARLVIERENEALRDATIDMIEAIGNGDGKPAKGEPHREHYAKHNQERNSDAVRHDPVLCARFDEHLAAHIARLMPMHPDYAGDEILSLTGQEPLAPPTTPEGQGAAAQQAQAGKPPAGPPKPPNGKPAAKGEPAEGGSKPGQAGMPTNPTSGERMPGTPPGPPQVGA